MSPTNVEVLREMLEACQREDWPAAIAAFHPDVALDQSRMPDGRVYRGADGVWSFYRRFFGTWEQLEIRPQRFIEVDRERILVLVEIRARGRGSGIALTMATGDLYTLRAGRIVHMAAYPDQGEALAAVGRRE